MGQKTAIHILGQQGIASFTDLYHVELGYPVLLHAQWQWDAVLLDQHPGR